VEKGKEAEPSIKTKIFNGLANSCMSSKPNYKRKATWMVRNTESKSSKKTNDPTTTTTNKFLYLQLTTHQNSKHPWSYL